VISHMAHGGMGLDAVVWVAMACLEESMLPLNLALPPCQLLFLSTLVEVEPT
jgi:hypothetical protein